MVNQKKIFSFELKCQAKNVFPRDVERTVSYLTLNALSSAEFAQSGKCNPYSTIHDYCPFGKVCLTYYTPDATIQSNCYLAPIQDETYFHTNMLLFIRKSGAGFYPC